jgi:hypothetical protein
MTAAIQPPPILICHEVDARMYMHVEIGAEGRMVDVNTDEIQAVERVPTGALAPGSHHTDEDPQWHRQTVLWLSGGARILIGVTTLEFHQQIIDTWRENEKAT